MKIFRNLIIISCLLILPFNAKAGYEGYGPLKLNDTVLKYFIKYLSTKDQNTTKGAERHGKGWIFFVEENGLEFGYVYCPQGRECVPDLVPAKRACEKNVKKYLKRKGKCKLFAKQRTIVWDNKRIKIPIKASNSEIEEILRNNGWID